MLARMQIEHELHQRALQPRQRALQHDEARARQFRRRLEIHQAQAPRRSRNAPSGCSCWENAAARRCGGLRHCRSRRARRARRQRADWGSRRARSPTRRAPASPAPPSPASPPCAQRPPPSNPRRPARPCAPSPGRFPSRRHCAAPAPSAIGRSPRGARRRGAISASARGGRPRLARPAVEGLTGRRGWS